jgi:ubiquinone/menaquinone biosynthesis C-methylase UbiE
VSIWSRVVAATYDRVGERAERTGLAATRAELLAQVRGRTLEIGAGTGRNVDHYPAAADVTFSEPDPHMAKRLRTRGKSVVGATVDALPFDDDSFDTVVSTLVLCSVRDVATALGEIHRVLAPGGRLLFLEHVRADRGTPLEHWQDRLNRPWRALALGCNCNRDLPALLVANGFHLDEVQRTYAPFMPPLLRPLASGVAS